MASLHVQLIDASYSAFNNVTGGGDQHNIYPTNNSTATLDILPYAEGASWNPELICLPDTRTELVGEIEEWIYTANESGTAEILWLCDVAGSGKSSVAHTIARNCLQARILGSSFFFDRNIPDRRSPLKLFSTIARDLLRLSNDLAAHIVQVLEDDRSVASAGQTRQFEELILKPVRQHHISGRPAVVVIDALDEGCDRVTLEILRNQVPKLPGTFRFLITSRPADEICTDLFTVDHIRYRSLDIYGNINQRDIALYIRDRLRYISSRRQLPADWPGEQRTHEFTRQAEGLFVWVSTVSEYLLTAAYPDRKLTTLLYERNVSCRSAEAKMDALYVEVLNACDWNDRDFVHDYKLVIGTIIAAKTPLSSSALQSLHREHPTLEVGEVLRPLSSVLTGFVNEHPIRIIHLSFRDFLTYGTQVSLNECFRVSEREHSQRLALSCLHLLNEDLTSDIPGTGYLSELAPETMVIPPLDVSEALWYACRFWAEHIIEVEGSILDGGFEFQVSLSGFIQSERMAPADISV
ncbi:hypothetical protein PILCRDRAFT_651647 [Piloderma croceum F 1598]|uniref:Nephrocystin 3-like N-terminal domain-containing protein n=1 Tax=Piloderma croceum (strain F 1598) TaxID=765440 RepID=A0A0C3AQI5_PILCF|nr:hypothetical protein PILCRDRAFT_651647 [Piloderma croceum F 1598]